VGSIQVAYLAKQIRGYGPGALALIMVMIVGSQCFNGWQAAVSAGGTPEMLIDKDLNVDRRDARENEPPIVSAGIAQLAGTGQRRSRWMGIALPDVFQSCGVVVASRRRRNASVRAKTNW